MSVDTFRQPVPARLILDWTAAFALATAVATAAGVVTFAPMIGRMLSWQAFPATTTLVLATAAIGALHGFVVGSAQAFVLRRRLHGRAGGWILATTLGAVMAWTACLFLNFAGAAAILSNAEWMRLVLVGGLAFGAVVGTAQWIALRTVVPRAALWIPANSLAWLLGSFVIIGGFGLANAAGSSVGGMTLVLLTTVAASLVAGLTTALALARIVRRAEQLEAMRIRNCLQDAEELTGRIPRRTA